MKAFICGFLLLGAVVLAEERVKRQASYTFPGPRSERGHRQQQNTPVYIEDRDDGESYQAPRRQFQAQHVQPQYAPSQARAPAPAPVPVAAAPPPPPPPPVYEAPRAPQPAPRSHSDSSPAPRRRASSSNNRANKANANKYNAAPQQSLNGHDEEEEQVPDPLTLLLEDSQFTCGGKGDGYYADDSVNCQVFHYCVGGAKHSWMCPENTVFHQVHLNCVPDAQDICSQSQKFHFVNEYLYKPVDYEGPNKTARYSQRYYPDGYSVGDQFATPQDQGQRRPAPAPQPQSYPAPAPAPRQPARHVAPPPPAQPSFRVQPESYSPSAQSRPASRPRPLESYPVEAPQNYRGSPQSQPAPPPPQESYRGAPSQRDGPPPQAYRVVSAQPAAPAPKAGYSSEENNYQPQTAPQSRRPSAPAPQRPAAGYTPPRQQYRPSARSSAGYQPYGSNQAAGVQYDEDY